MAKENNILGVTGIFIGDPGDGVMGTDLIEFNDIEVGSTGLEGSQANEETISTEGNDAYLTVDNDATPTTLTFRAYGVTPEQRVELMGGRVGTSADGEDEGNYLAPSSIVPIYKSVKLVGKEINGKRGVFKIPYGKVTARESGTITKNGLPAVEIAVTANTPETSAGVKGAPYILGWETVEPQV